LMSKCTGLQSKLRRSSRASTTRRTKMTRRGLKVRFNNYKLTPKRELKP